MLKCQMPRKRKVEPVQIFPDGREVCVLRTASGRREYEERTRDMWSRQRGLCPICTFSMHSWDATFEHEDLRGMGGARRDDRIWKVDEEGNKMPINFAVHGHCNGAKGSKRMTLSREGEI